MTVIDISDPTNLVTAGNYDTPDRATKVAVAGDYAFIPDRTSGLLVIDISDPTNPVLADSYDSPGTALHVTVAGNYAYLADNYSGLQVIQVFERSMLLSANQARSLRVDSGAGNIAGAKVSSTQMGAGASPLLTPTR